MRNIVACVWIAACLAGCCADTRPSPKLAERERVLRDLRTCLADVADGKTPSHDAPCFLDSLGALKGVSRANLVGALGTPTWCYGPTLVDAATDGCPLGWDPSWVFFPHVSPYIGGGAELVCQSNGSQRCDDVVWSSSQ